MRELKDRLKEILKAEYRITNDAELVKALENMPGVDIGIFVSTVKEGEKSA